MVGAQALWQLQVEADERIPAPPAGWRYLGMKFGSCGKCVEASGRNQSATNVVLRAVQRVAGQEAFVNLALAAGTDIQKLPPDKLNAHDTVIPIIR